MLSFLGFGKESFPLVNLRAFGAWWKRQPVNDALALQEQAVRLLKALPTYERPPDQNRLDALFALDGRLTVLRATLAAQYIASARANSTVEARLWSANYDLVSGFIAAYEFMLKEAPQRVNERKWQQSLPALLGRLIYYRGLDAKFRLFRHESWIPGRWHELHANYALACMRGVAQTPMPLADVEQPAVTIEQQYLCVLLMQLITTGNVRPPQIEWTVAHIPRWAKDLSLSVKVKSHEGFCVDLASSDGLRRTGEQMQGGQFLYLDTTVMHTRMLQQAMAIRDELDLAAGEKRHSLEEQLDALRKLTPCFATVFKPFARSADREEEVGHSRVMFSFKGICKMLEEIEEDKEQVQKAAELYSYSETAAMYVYGFVDEEISSRRTREQKLFAPPPREYGEPAQMQDRSSTGCRLIVAADLVAPGELGTLVAVRQGEEGVWALGIVRRIRKINAEEMEVGVQLISPAIARVSLRKQRQLREPLTGYSVDGVTATPLGQRVDALCLEQLAETEAQASGMSIILPSSEYRSAQHMTLQDGPEVFNILLREAQERQVEWTWASADVLGGTLD